MQYLTRSSANFSEDSPLRFNAQSRVETHANLGCQLTDDLSPGKRQRRGLRPGNPGDYEGTAAPGQTERRSHQRRHYSSLWVYGLGIRPRLVLRSCTRLPNEVAGRNCHNRLALRALTQIAATLIQSYYIVLHIIVLFQ